MVTYERIFTYNGKRIPKRISFQIGMPNAFYKTFFSETQNLWDPLCYALRNSNWMNKGKVKWFEKGYVFTKYGYFLL